MLVLIAVMLPDVRPQAGERRPVPGRWRQMMPVIGSNALAFLGQYALYTYVSVLLLRSGASSGTVGPILLVFGVVFGLAGAWSASRRLDRHLRSSALAILAIPAGAWVNASSNAGIAAGAALGGVVLGSAGIREVTWLAAGLVILTVVMVLLARRAFGQAP